MNIDYVICLYTQLENIGIEIWIDGGWGVDALLGEQTRAHDDVDIVILQKNMQTLHELLERQVYRDVPRDDTSPWNFVLGDDRGRLVDVHVIALDAQGNGIYGPAERGEMYPAASLMGAGTLAGQAVRCISPEYLVKFHSGYKLRDKDFRDVAALCARFGIDLPEEYASWKSAADRQRISG